ncbi:hypothetical protein SeMB42_g01663 [Synchytrium endobioticum]|uniref:non-specific serine/threonine protein kinase n=1 Tax=Synchytrium endobioticum TaxID=286115 RepID=A0A507DB30_9FUNG|nr:hypothetical protein SeLEV6574_g02230 [Synchytrium endobioticum]TPX52075.1 hypothetical protein SeMB42_g01663 [Synchytrium endobioticum]
MPIDIDVTPEPTCLAITIHSASAVELPAPDNDARDAFGDASIPQLQQRQATVDGQSRIEFTKRTSAHMPFASLDLLARAASPQPQSQPQHSATLKSSLSTTVLMEQFQSLGITNSYPKYIPGLPGPLPRSSGASVASSPLLMSHTNTVTTNGDDADVPDMNIGSSALGKRRTSSQSEMGVRDSISSNGSTLLPGHGQGMFSSLLLNSASVDKHAQSLSESLSTSIGATGTNVEHEPTLTPSMNTPMLCSTVLQPLGPITETLSVENILVAPSSRVYVGSLGRKKTAAPHILQEAKVRNSDESLAMLSGTASVDHLTVATLPRARDDTLAKKKPLLHRFFHRESVTSQDGEGGYHSGTEDGCIDSDTDMRRPRSSVNSESNSPRPRSIFSKVFGLYLQSSSPGGDEGVEGGDARSHSKGSQENLKEEDGSPNQVSQPLHDSPVHTDYSHHSSHHLAFSFFRKHHSAMASEHHASGSHVHEEGDHHNLLKEILIHRRIRSSHHAPAVGPLTSSSHPDSVAGPPSPGDSPTLTSASVTSKKGMQRTTSDQSMTEKYGKLVEVLGRGANAVVKLAHKSESGSRSSIGEKLYAVKKFRKQRKCESYKEYVKKLVAEFCISASMHHENVVETVDLIQDESYRWCEVMEYLGGGDLFAYISKTTLRDHPAALNCFFKQLVSGIAYIHSMGVAHRDLKPENLLLDPTHTYLKITDFGVSEVFRTCFEKAPRKVKGLCGSEPYISPEEWVEGAEYDPCKVDVWAIGIIYYTMLYKSVPWRTSKPSDTHYTAYLARRRPAIETGSAYGFPPFDRQPPGTRDMLYRLLDPNPDLRISMIEIMNDPWFQKLEMCSKVKKEGLEGQIVSHKHPEPAKC